MTDIDVHGPIDFVLLEFDGSGPLDETAGAIMDQGLLTDEEFAAQKVQVAQRLIGRPAAPPPASPPSPRGAPG